MISLKDINKAVNEKIKLVFPSVEIMSTDIKEGFKRPSFFVELDNVKKSPYNTTAIERSMTVRIYYFPSDRNKFKIELMEVQEGLEDAFFQCLKVQEGFSIPIDEVETEIADGVLQCTFDIQYIESLDSEHECHEDTNSNNELIENLDMNI